MAENINCARAWQTDHKTITEWFFYFFQSDGHCGLPHVIFFTSARNLLNFDFHVPIELRALFKMADSSDEVTFNVTWSEIARAVLLRVFKRISPVLGAHVRSAYQEVYGEDGLLTAGKDCLSRRMLAKIEKTPDVLLHDIFIMTELMAARLDRVFLGRWFRGVVGASHHSALLQSLSADVDCVSRTRTWLFHGVDVSIGEVYRCVQSVVRLVTRLPLNVCQHFIDELEGDLQVRFMNMHA